MGFYLFDNPRLGIIVAVVIELILLLCWVIMPGRVRKSAFLAGPVVAGVFILMDVFVETYREQLEFHTRQVVQAAEDEDAQTIIDLLSDDLLLAGGIDKSRFSKLLESYMSGPFIRTNIVRKLEVLKAEKAYGQVEVLVITNTDPKGSYAIYSLLKTRWQFDYKRNESDEYKIVDLQLLELNDSKPPAGVLKRKYR
ncbi:MAG: hypothetical protein IID32_05365 [Planctomycetes bacterium]|nr:hypothetical protein [Planctomycetota bacterium]